MRTESRQTTAAARAIKIQGCRAFSVPGLTLGFDWIIFRGGTLVEAGRANRTWERK